jgi:hypothetical protein
LLPLHNLGRTLVKQQLFETGVDEMSWDDLSQSREDWPSIRDCHAYRKTAYDIILRMLKTTTALDGPASWDTPGWAIFMGFEHERIHIETSSVLIREVSSSSCLHLCTAKTSAEELACMCCSA